ncbi:MAG: hypothetical protein QOJ73_7293 [Streptosporangiaceae bacterium]|nr:hypothetical protein [Streptosporangiaceae bacterium]
MRRPGRDGWSSAPSIEMLDAAADADEGADECADDDHDRQARLRAMAAALGVLYAVPRDM